MADYGHTIEIAEIVVSDFFDAPPLGIFILAAGLTSTTYKVSFRDNEFVVKIPNARVPCADIQHGLMHEANCLQRLDGTEISPKLIGHVKAGRRAINGALIMSYLAGGMMDSRTDVHTVINALAVDHRHTRRPCRHDYRNVNHALLTSASCWLSKAGSVDAFRPSMVLLAKLLEDCECH